MLGVNIAQILMWVAFMGALLVSGVALRRVVLPEKDISGVSLWLGECLLLGSIWVVGLLVFVSLLHLYVAVVIWGVVLAQYICLLQDSVRREINAQCRSLLSIDVFSWIAVLLLMFFLFRNCFFLVDVDSHSTYLYAQKLWLHYKHSLFADTALDVKALVPHFNAVPYALGLSIFPRELLFSQLVVAQWTLIAALLVFGYTRFRFNSAYALAAVMGILFNDHMFYSGANNCCVINSALVALLFAAGYSFRESAQARSPQRLVFAFVCVITLMANKYQMAYVAVMFVIFGLMVQAHLIEKVKELLRQPRWWVVLLAAVVLTGLWYLKSWIATGLPAFPIMAGKFGVLGWEPELEKQFSTVMTGPLNINQILKYFSYLIVWPGIHVGKIVAILLILLPVLSAISFARVKPKDGESLGELGYWLTLCIIIVAGICMVSFVDPRHYRYAIAVMAFAGILGLRFILLNLMRLPSGLVSFLVVIIFAWPWHIMIEQDGPYKRPSIKDNLAVLTDKINTDDIIDRYYPDNRRVDQQLTDNNVNKERSLRGAWDIGIGGYTKLSAFLLPIKPQVGVWFTTVVRFSSMNDEKKITADLERHTGFDWVMSFKDDELIFESKQDYARRIKDIDLHLDELFYNYGFPAELSVVHR
jgi:hypothetical protein